MTRRWRTVRNRASARVRPASAAPLGRSARPLRHAATGARASPPAGPPPVVPFVARALRPRLALLCALAVESSLCLTALWRRLRLAAFPSVGLYVPNWKSEIGSGGWAKSA